MYRTIELIDGWDGRIIKNELYFNILDGAMIVASMFCLNILHPGQLLGHGGAPAKGLPRLNSSTDTLAKVKEAGEWCDCGCVPKPSSDERSEV